MKDRCKQAASGAWYARATWTDPVTGERRYKHVSAPTQRKCADRLLSEIASGREGRSPRIVGMTVGALLDLWLTAQHGRVKTSTYTYYESRVRHHLRPRFGAMKLDRLTPATVQRVYARMADDGCSASIIASTHRILHSALTLAERQGSIQRNVASLVSPPRYTYPEAAVWTAEDAARFLAWCDTAPMYGPLCALALYTGLRQGELLALRWRDVDLDAAALRVVSASYRGVITTPKTAASRRAVALSPACVAVLSRHHALRAASNRVGPEDLLFSRPDGRVLSFVTVRKQFISGCAVAGVPPIRFHGLRHTHATLMLAAGVHPKVVQERLGHSSITVTMDRYSHHVSGLQAPAALALDATLRAKSVQHVPETSKETA